MANAALEVDVDAPAGIRHTCCNSADTTGSLDGKGILGPLPITTPLGYLCVCRCDTVATNLARCTILSLAVFCPGHIGVILRSITKLVNQHMCTEGCFQSLETFRLQCYHQATALHYQTLNRGNYPLMMLPPNPNAAAAVTMVWWERGAATSSGTTCSRDNRGGRTLSALLPRPRLLRLWPTSSSLVRSLRSPPMGFRANG